MTEHAAKTYESMLTVSVEGFKTLLLINGGGVVALLTYLGQVESAGLAHNAGWAVGGFVVGVLLSVLAFAGAYATQYALFNESMGRADEMWWRHQSAMLLTAATALLGVVAFAVGACASISLLAS